MTACSCSSSLQSLQFLQCQLQSLGNFKPDWLFPIKIVSRQSQCFKSGTLENEIPVVEIMEKSVILWTYHRKSMSLRVNFLSISHSKFKLRDVEKLTVAREGVSTEVKYPERRKINIFNQLPQ